MLPKDAMKSRKTGNKAKVCLVASFLILLYWFTSLNVTFQSAVKQTELSIFNAGWKKNEFNRVNCFQNDLKIGLEKLPENLKIWSEIGLTDCRSLYLKFKSMYSVEVQRAELKLRSEMERKVNTWLGNNKVLFEEVQSQVIFTMHDHYNHRYSVFNAVRGKRPMAGTNQSNKMFVSEPSDAEKSKCDFCHPLTMTAEDTFGRIHGKYTVSAANVFKVAKWHGLFITKRHNIFNMTEVEFLDLFDTAMRWFKTVNSKDPNAKYPVLFWDMFPHAGASQVHVHVHGILGSKTYPGQFGDTLSMVKEFRNQEHSYYWSSLIQIHETLGLSVRFKNAIAIAPLVPHRSHELWLLALEPSTDLFQLLYYTIKMYQDIFGQFCYSMGAAMPVLNQQQFELEESLPALIQIGTRGDCSSSVNDISSVELYLFNNVNTDPYETISNLQHYVNKQKSKDNITKKE